MRSRLRQLAVLDHFKPPAHPPFLQHAFPDLLPVWQHPLPFVLLHLTFRTCHLFTQRYLPSQTLTSARFPPRFPRPTPAFLPPPPLPTTMPSVSVSTRQCRSLHSKAPCSGQGCLIHFPQDRDAIRRSISADRIADGLVPAGLAGLAIEQWASSPSKPGGARGVGGRGYQSTGVEGYKKVGRDELMVCRQSPDRTAGSDGGRPC